jgi:hypothetical protein
MKDSKFFKDWKNEPGSVKFWNLIVLLILVLSPIFSLELFYAELLLGSIIDLGFLIDNDRDGDSHYWIMLMPLTWVLFIISLIAIGVGFSISYFNSWLDKIFNKEKDGDGN